MGGWGYAQRVQLHGRCNPKMSHHPLPVSGHAQTWLADTQCAIKGTLCTHSLFVSSSLGVCASGIRIIVRAQAEAICACNHAPGCCMHQVQSADRGTVRCSMHHRVWLMQVVSLALLCHWVACLLPSPCDLTSAHGRSQSLHIGLIPCLFILLASSCILVFALKEESIA